MKYKLEIKIWIKTFFKMLVNILLQNSFERIHEVSAKHANR